MSEAKFLFDDWSSILAEASSRVEGTPSRPATEPPSVREEILQYIKTGHLTNLEPQFLAYMLQGLAYGRVTGRNYPVRSEKALQKIEYTKAHWHLLNDRLVRSCRFKLVAVLTNGETDADIIKSFNGKYSPEAASFWQWVAMTDNVLEQAYVLLCSEDEQQRAEGAKLMHVVRIIEAEMKRQLTAWERAIVASQVGNRETIAEIISPLGILFQQHEQLSGLTGVRIIVEEMGIAKESGAEVEEAVGKKRKYAQK